MQASSPDLRRRIVAAVAAGMSTRAVARRYDVSPASVKRFVAMQRTHGSLEPLPRPGRAHANLAELELLAGRPEAACVRLERFLARPGVGDAGAHFVTDLLPGLAKAYLARGDWERAEELSASSVGSARAKNNRQALSAGLRVRGMVLTRQERWEEAQRSFEEALAVARAMPMLRDEAFALYEYGRMHVLQGREEEGRKRLLEALVLFQQLGAQLDVEQTEQALAAL